MKKNLVKAGLASAMSLAAVVAPAAEGLWFDNAAEGENAYNFTDAQVKVSDEYGNSVEDVEYHGDITEDATSETKVYAVVASRFEVVVPKTIVLAGRKNVDSTAVYKIDVDGDIAGDEYVTVIPDASFDMKADDKAAVTANVKQVVKKFYASNNTNEALWGDTVADAVKMNADDDDVTGNVETTGEISALLTAGAWTGTFDFDIKLNRSENYTDCADDFLTDLNANEVFDGEEPEEEPEEELKEEDEDAPEVPEINGDNVEG